MTSKWFAAPPVMALLAAIVMAQPNSNTVPPNTSNRRGDSNGTASEKPTTTDRQSGPQGDRPGTGNDFNTLMNAHIKAALHYLVTKVDPYERQYVRFLSFYDLDTPAAIRRAVKFTNWWLNQMSFDEYYHLMAPVPSTGFRLFAVDLRDYRWNTAAWYSVASREPRFRQPWLHFREAEELRREAGYYDVKPGEDGTTPAVVVLSGNWFLRDTLETNRSPSYYDLLFASRRFVLDKDKKHEFKFVTHTREIWPGGVDPKDGKDYKPGEYITKNTDYRTVQDWKSYTFHDFPKDQGELEEALGIDKMKEFALKSQIDIDNGAIVAGGRDHPKEGSIVALQNRLIAVQDGPLGAYMQTFDVKRTSGLKDYSQALLFAGKPFKRGEGAKAVRDAGEILFYLRNGGQGGILVDGVGKRIELAAGEVANDTSDPHLNAGVRTYGSCAACHAGGGGWVPPKDLYAKWKEDGIRLKFYDREQRNRVEGFFSQLEDRMESHTIRYQRLVKNVTQPFADEVAVGNVAPRPWSGADAAAEVLRFRGEYDGPVSTETAAKEMGLPLPALKWLCLRVGVEGPNQKGVVVQRNQRSAELVRDKEVPRSVWDDDLFKQVGLTLDAHAGDPEFKKVFDTVTVPYPR